MKKKLISLLTALSMTLMLFMCMPISVSADAVGSGDCGAGGDNVTWSLDSNGVLTISGSGNMKIPDCEIHEFTSGKDLMNFYVKGMYEVIILDVEMPELNGLETAERIRRIDNSVIIFFLTNYAEFAVQGYDVGVFRYILKTQPEYIYTKQLNSIINECKQRFRNFIFTNKNLSFRFRLTDILYFEGHKRFDVSNGFVTLRSDDKEDLKNGFHLKYSEEYHKKHGYYYIKIVPFSKLSSLTETVYTFIYKGEEMEVVGRHWDENKKFMHLLGHKIGSPVPEKYPNLVDEYNKYLNDGFEKR